MGIDYTHYLIPDGNCLAPDDGQLARLADALLAGAWVPTDSRARLGPFRWNVVGSFADGLRYPFAGDVVDPDGRSYAIALAHHDALVDPSGDEPDLRCPCGAELGYVADPGASYVFGVRRACPACGRATDPTRWDLPVQRTRTGSPELVRGGLVHRFALVVDCGRCWPVADGLAHLDPDLVGCCRDLLGCELHEVGSYE